MTDGLGVNGEADDDAQESRLQLSPNARTSPHLDGAWWPRSSELAAALPVLVEELSDRLGTVAFVGYHQSAWTQTPPQMQIGGQNVQLQGFTSDDPATIILIGRADAERTAEIARWCEEAAQQFVDAKVQTFVPVLVHHIVHDRMSLPHAAA